MIYIKFKNLEKSELARDIVQERLDDLTQKFSDLKDSKIQVTLEMENSPVQAGPDLFKVKLQILNGRYKGVIMEKSNSNLYIALAEVVDRTLDIINRTSDRTRVKQRGKARQLFRLIEQGVK